MQSASHLLRSLVGKESCTALPAKQQQQQVLGPEGISPLEQIDAASRPRGDSPEGRGRCTALLARQEQQQQQQQQVIGSERISTDAANQPPAGEPCKQRQLHSPACSTTAAAAAAGRGMSKAG
jgi:hypothetical protein